MIDLSICITTYNLEKYIEQTIESVFSQKTKYTFEVLVGDDGSTDRTIEVVKSMQKKYKNIKYFIMDRDYNKKYDHIVRASSNRYNLLKNATGKYITFLDGDDFYIDESKIEKQIDILEKNLDCNVCAHNMNYYYEKNNSTKPIGETILHRKKRKLSFKRYWQSEFYVPAEACIFRNNFDLIPENEVFYKKYFDDNFIIYMALQKGKCFYIPDIMANYRQNESGYANWDKTKQILVNTMDVDIERKFNKKNKTSVIVRHFYGIKYLYKYDKNDIKEKYPLIYNKAVEDDAQFFLRLIEKKVSKVEFFKMRVLFIFSKLLEKIKKIFER